MTSTFQDAGTGRRRIVKFALAQRWPVIGFTGEWAEQGALLSYGIDDLVVNLRTARALGITIPQSILLQASQVIE